MNIYQAIYQSHLSWAIYQIAHDLILYIDRCKVDFYDPHGGDGVGYEAER